jgi:hypothetical protein
MITAESINDGTHIELRVFCHRHLLREGKYIRCKQPSEHEGPCVSTDGEKFNVLSPDFDMGSLRPLYGRAHCGTIEEQIALESADLAQRTEGLSGV